MFNLGRYYDIHQVFRIPEFIKKKCLKKPRRSSSVTLLAFFPGEAWLKQEDKEFFPLFISPDSQGQKHSVQSITSVSLVSATET